MKSCGTLHACSLPRAISKFDINSKTISKIEEGTMQVPGLKFVSQISGSPDRPENPFDQRNSSSAPFNSTPTSPNPFPRLVSSPFPANGHPIPSAWNLPSNIRSIPGLEVPHFSSSNIADSAQEANVFKRSISPEIQVSKRQRLEESIPQGPAKRTLNGSLASGGFQMIHSSASISPEIPTGPKQVTSTSDRDKTLSIRRAKAQRYKLNKAMRKEALQKESLKFETETQVRARYNIKLGVFEAPPFIPSVNTTSPLKPKAIAPSNMDTSVLITNDIDHPISASEWISSGIRQSPFPSASNPQCMSLADAWQVFQTKTKDFRLFPILPILIVRHHLLSTLWHFTSSNDRRRYISAPEVMAGGVNVFQGLLTAVGCVVENKIKLSDKKWKFVFSLNVRSKFLFSGTMWTNILERAANRKLLNLNEDQIALSKLIDAWKSHRAAEPSISQSRPAIPSLTSPGQYQTTSWSDDEPQDISQDRALTPLLTETRIDLMDSQSHSFQKRIASSDFGQPFEIKSPSMPTYVRPQMPSVPGLAQMSVVHMDKTSAGSLPSNGQSSYPEIITMVEDTKGQMKALKTETSTMPDLGKSSKMGTETAMTKATSENTPFIDLIKSPPEPTQSSSRKVTADEVRLAELKSRILQSNPRRSTPSQLQKTAKPVIRKSRVVASDYFSEYLSDYFDFSEEFEATRLPSPELIVPPKDDWWAQLNYEKRGAKVDLEYLNSFLRD